MSFPCHLSIHHYFNSMKKLTSIILLLFTFSQLALGANVRSHNKPFSERVETLTLNTSQANVSCFVAGTLVHTPNGTVPIEDLKIGDRVLTDAEEVIGATPKEDSITQEDAHLITLHMKDIEGFDLEIKTIKNSQWLKDNFIEKGGLIYLSMQELGAVGQAKIVDIAKCPELKKGKGRLVTSTFKHLSSLTLDIEFKDSTEKLGVTITHPIFVIGKGWTPAGDLKLGDQVKMLFGTTEITAIASNPNYRIVYNLEVDVDHVYRIQQKGILVHNNCPVPRKPGGGSNTEDFIGHSANKHKYDPSRAEFKASQYGEDVDVKKVREQTINDFHDAWSVVNPFFKGRHYFDTRIFVRNRN